MGRHDATGVQQLTTGEHRPGRPLRSARYKLTRVIRSTIIGICGFFVVSVVSVALIFQQQQLVTTTLRPLMLANTQLLQGITNAETGVRGYELSGDRSFLTPYTDALQPLNEALAVLSDLTAEDPALGNLVVRQRTAVEQWLTSYAEPVVGGSLSGAELDAAQANAKDLVDEVRTTNAAIGAMLESRTAESFQTSLRIVVVGLVLLLGVAIGSAIGSLRPAVRALNAISPPLEQLAETMRRLEAGESGLRADPDLGVLEVRQLARNFNLLADTNELQREQLAEQLRLSEVVRTISFRVGTSLQLGEVIDDSIKPIHYGFHSDGTWIRAFEGTGEAPGRGRGAIRPTGPATVPPPEVVTVAGKVARRLWKRHAVLVLTADRVEPADALKPEEAAPIWEFASSAFGAQQLALVPVGSGRDALGYFGITRSSGRAPWSDAEVAAAAQLGREIGQAFRHARLYERERSVVEGLRALDHKKDAFVSMVSHELRTPLASIIGHLEVVRSGDLGPIPASVDPSLAAIDRNSTRLASLIEDLLLLSKIEEGARPLTVRPVDVAALARNAVASLQLYGQRRSITVSLHVDSDTWVDGEPHELDRVANNLITNAIKFSPPGSVVEVTVGRDGDQAFFRVRDRGMGISEADQEQLFTRYFRSTNPEAHLVPGTGLGLNLAKVMVERHGGTIGVDSALGRGSTFEVRLPARGTTSRMTAVGVAGRA